jgi:hypothetical protein
MLFFRNGIYKMVFGYAGAAAVEKKAVSYMFG